MRSLSLFLILLSILTSCGRNSSPENDVFTYTYPSSVQTYGDQICSYDGGTYRPYNRHSDIYVQNSDLSCDDANYIIQYHSDIYYAYTYTYLPTQVNYLTVCPAGTSLMYYGYAYFCANNSLVVSCNLYAPQWGCRCVPVTWYGYSWGQGICL